MLEPLYEMPEPAAQKIKAKERFICKNTYLFFMQEIIYRLNAEV